MEELRYVVFRTGFWSQFQALQGKGEAETTGEDNLIAMRLVFAAFESTDARHSTQKAAE